MSHGFDSITYFWQNAKLNIYQGQVPINLVNLFPLLKQGYRTGKTHDNLINTYNILNNLSNPKDHRFIIPDDLYNEAFNGNIHARNYIFETKGRQISIITMEDAISKNIIEKPLNIFQRMRSDFNDFDPTNINKKYISQIKNYDAYFLDLDPTLEKEVHNELNLSDNIYEIIVYLEDLSFENFIIEIFRQNRTKILNTLIADAWINLLSGIIFNNVNVVSNSTIDPRIHDNEAYKLALKYQNVQIIKILEDKIVKRRLLEQEAISQLLIPLAGHTDVARTVFSTLL